MIKIKETEARYTFVNKLLKSSGMSMHELDRIFALDEDDQIDWF